MKITQVMMTPEWAESLLDKNVDNRPLSLVRVRQLAKAIMEGEWQMSHQGIAVSTSGKLLDGQHRLAAIILAGKAVPLLLTTECDPAIFKVVDTGYKRTAGQVLSMGGAFCPKDAASTCRLVMAYERVPHLVWASPSITYTNSDIVEWYEGARGQIDFALKLGISGRNRLALVRTSSLAAFVFIACRAGYAESTLTRYVDQLCNGDGLQKDDPVFSFRRAIINRAPDVLFRANSRASQAWIASLISVFNSWASGRSVKLFRVPQFPPMPEIESPGATF